MAEAEIRSPGRHWFHIPLQLVVAGFWIYWHWHLPAPNKAVLLLAGVATVIAFVEMRPVHKVIYVGLIIALMSTENLALDKDRADFVRDEAGRRREEHEQFTAIGNTITQNVQKVLDDSDKKFAQDMDRSDRIIDRVGDTIKTETGGDSFAYITFTPEPANVRFTQFPATSGPQFLVSITSHGKYPLREVRATMMDDERRVAAAEKYTQHPDGDWMKAIQSTDTVYEYPYLRPQSPESPSGDVESLGLYPVPKESSKQMNIAFSSLNGYWNETLHLGLVNGAWRQCLSILGPTTKQTVTPFIYCEPEWPEGRALAEKDWSGLKGPATRR